MIWQLMVGSRQPIAPDGVTILSGRKQGQAVAVAV